MVATVGSISIDLSTNTAKFTQGFKASASTVERESKRMSNAVNGFAKSSAGMFKSFAGGFLGGAAASVGLDSFAAALNKARQSLSDFEEIGNRAKATGLGTDTFQAISHGAALADVEQESLNKSLEIFAKNVGLAEKGSGGLYSSLIKLNPQLLQSVLSAGDQESRLKLVADAMANMTDATQKAALATAVFGRGGAEMVRVLDKGSQSINEMKRNAEALGIIIPEELIKRSGELDDQLTTLATVIDVNIKSALANLGPGLVAGATGLAEFAKGVNQLATALSKYTGNKGADTFLEVVKRMANPLTLLNPSGLGADAAEAIINSADDASEAQDRLQKELLETQKDLGNMMAEVGKNGMTLGLRAAIDAAIQKIKDLKQEINETGQAAVEAGDQIRRAFLRSEFRKSEAASMAAMPPQHPLPTVHGGGGGGIDPETGEKIERAIEKETEATNRVAARATDVYRGVQQFDSHSAGYFDQLGSRIDSGLQAVGRALSYSVPSGSGYATSGANSFRYSGNNSSGSWAGRQMTFGGNSEADTAYYNSVFGGRKYRVGGTEDASSITSGATGTTSGAINVSVVVKPILEGTRLSGQSTSEIKQAASAGANAALRAYYGR